MIVETQTWLPSEMYVDRYKTEPLEAADKLFEAWQKEHATHIDIWDCDFATKEFFNAFLDKCRENGLLKEALKVWWGVHSCPGPDTIPSFGDYVDQWIIDYSVKHGMRSETAHLKGLDRFKLVNELRELYNVDDCFFTVENLAYVFPNPRDSEGRYIPMIEDENGNAVPWPKNADGSFVRLEETLDDK